METQPLWWLSFYPIFLKLEKFENISIIWLNQKYYLKNIPWWFRIAFFLKIRLIFNIFYCFRMFVNILHILDVHISAIKKCYNMIPSVHYFCIETEMLADFQICISVPLSIRTLKVKYFLTSFCFPLIPILHNSLLLEHPM